MWKCCQRICMLITYPLYEKTVLKFQVISPEYKQYPENGKEIKIILGMPFSFRGFCQINKYKLAVHYSLLKADVSTPKDSSLQLIKTTCIDNRSLRLRCYF